MVQYKTPNYWQLPVAGSQVMVALPGDLAVAVIDVEEAEAPVHALFGGDGNVDELSATATTYELVKPFISAKQARLAALMV